MTTLAIKDLTINKVLDRQAMKTYLGGGAAVGQLFSLWAAPSRSGLNRFPSSSTFVNTVNNFVTQIFIDTLQLNQVNQTVTITDSDNATVGQSGNAQNAILDGMSPSVPVSA